MRLPHVPIVAIEFNPAVQFVRRANRPGALEEHDADPGTPSDENQAADDRRNDRPRFCFVCLRVLAGWHGQVCLLVGVISARSGRGRPGSPCIGALWNALGLPLSRLRLRISATPKTAEHRGNHGQAYLPVPPDAHVPT